jgi:hypothetical protein
VETDVRWHRGQTLAAGQVAEFKVWAELVRQSMGGLHVFLPLRDMGIDGVVHRLQDGAYVAIQVKGRTELTPAGQVHITVTATSLRDDNALVVGVLVDGEQLGRMVLVVPESKFRELAAHDVVNGREYLTAAFELHEGGRSRWAPFLVASEHLAERFGCGDELVPEPPSGGVVSLDRGREGFLGESEVIRRLAEADSLNLFRPFPDLETVEVLAWHVKTRRFLGLQAKTAGWDQEHAENRVYFRRSSFRASPTTYVCVLGWDRGGGRFEDGCLLIPSGEIAGLARVEGDWLVLEVQPASQHHPRLEAYRTPLASLGTAVQGMLESGT